MADLPNPGLDPTSLFGPQGPLLPPQQRAMVQALAQQQGGNANPSFTDPAYTTLGQVDLLRKQALHNTTEQDPAKSWAGVLGNIAQTWGGLQQQGRAEDLQKKAMEYSNQAQQPAQGGGLLGGAPSGGGRGATDTPQSLASYYTSQGMPAVGAGAMAAGQYAESGLDPSIRHVGDGRDGSDSVGYGQWNGPRARDKAAYAASIGRTPNDPQVNRDFTLVELGMKGDPSTPGYGTQVKVRQALLQAQNPQQATAAALAYENPANKAVEYQKRLALTNALVGGGAAGAGGAARGAQPPVQMAQAQNPMGPFAGMTPAQASFNSMNPYTQGNQEMVRGMYSPQGVTGPGDYRGYSVVGQNPVPRTAVPGMMPGTATSGGQSSTTFTPYNPYGTGNTGIAAPGEAPPGQPPAGPARPAGVPAPAAGVAPPSAAGRSAPPPIPSSANPVGSTSGGGASGLNGPAPSGPQIQSPFQSRFFNQGIQTDLQKHQAEAAMTAKSGLDAKEIESSQANTNSLQNARQSLQGLASAMDQYGGKMPTGAWGPEVLATRSIANMFGLTDPKQLATMEEYQKFATQYAQQQANVITGGNATNFDLQTTLNANPGMKTSNGGARILTDYLLHLNDVQQKYETAKQNYYQANGGTLTGFAQQWQKSIDGQGAIPLSKYPQGRAMINGQSAVKVQSTAKKGYSWIPESELQ